MKKITGVMVYYYFICKRKLWYFNKDLNMEFNSQLVGMGKLLDEDSYSREKKSIMIDETINIDFIKNWKVIHEVKKSKKLDIAGKWQLKYYIWTLKNKGLEVEKGIMDYPLIRKREEILFTEEDEEKLLEILLDINKIVDEKLPPKQLNKNFCNKCAYYELCYI